MRALLLSCVILPVLLLAGCNSLIRQNGDYFQAAGTDPARFAADDQACTLLANDFVAFDLHGMAGSGYQRNRNFNAFYARCMTGLGYASRPYVQNWLPAG